jgi:hypothetical protein
LATSAITLARKQGLPIVPVNVRARNSGLFYWFANGGFTELRDMTVFHELLNKRGKTFCIRFGPLIPNERIAAGDASEVTQRLQEHWWSGWRPTPRRSFRSGLTCSERIRPRARRGVLPSLLRKSEEYGQVTVFSMPPSTK